MNQAAPALLAADEALKEVARADHVLVDMHAEATSEKVALGWYLDGKVTAVVGTHTHVPTADARVLPGGTAYITDVGMTGARGGVIGVRREQSIAVMRTHMPQRYDPAEEDPWINAVLIRADRNGGAPSIEPVLRPVPLTPCRASSAIEQQRQEPDEVEVEPVRDGELERDQHRRAERRHGDLVALARNERDGDARAPRQRRSRRPGARRARRRGPRWRTATSARAWNPSVRSQNRSSPGPERDRRQDERTAVASAAARLRARPAAVA